MMRTAKATLLATALAQLTAIALRAADLVSLTIIFDCGLDNSLQSFADDERTPFIFCLDRRSGRYSGGLALAPVRLCRSDFPALNENQPWGSLCLPSPIRCGARTFR
jgi:hypothetical protein